MNRQLGFVSIWVLGTAVAVAAGCSSDNSGDQGAGGAAGFAGFAAAGAAGVAAPSGGGSPATGTGGTTGTAGTDTGVVGAAGAAGAAPVPCGSTMCMPNSSIPSIPGFPGPTPCCADASMSLCGTSITIPGMAGGGCTPPPMPDMRCPSATVTGIGDAQGCCTNDHCGLILFGLTCLDTSSAMVKQFLPTAVAQTCEGVPLGSGGATGSAGAAGASGAAGAAGAAGGGGIGGTAGASGAAGMSGAAGASGAAGSGGYGGTSGGGTGGF